MYKFLVGTDWHIRHSKPLIRTDDFHATQWNKMIQVFKYMEQYQCPLFHNGDLFDAYDVPLKLISEFIVAYRSTTRQPIYLNLGNHDLYGANKSDLSRTVCGLLHLAGVINIVNGGMFFKDSTQAEPQAQIHFIPYDVEFTPEQLKIKKHHSNVPLIILTHNMLTSRGGLPYPHYPVDQIETEADLVICGHWHSQFNLVNNKTIFLNCGPLTRQTKNETHQKPFIPLVTMMDQGDISIEKLPLRFEESPFDMSADLREATDADVGIADSFISTLSNSSVEISDVFNVVSQVGLQMGCAPVVISGAKKTLQRIHNEWEKEL